VVWSKPARPAPTPLTHYHYANFYLEWKSKYHTSQFGFFYDSHSGKDTDTLQIGNLPQELTNQMWQLMW